MNTTYDKLEDISFGKYLFQCTNVIEKEDIVDSIATSELFGNTIRTENNFFYWGPESEQYFCFDNVFDEIAIGLRIKLQNEEVIQSLVSELLISVGLTQLIDISSITSPFDLSGGQQQRLLVAVIASRGINRILAHNPLLYVERKSRQELYKLIGQSINVDNGLLCIIPEETESILDLIDGIITYTNNSFHITGNIKRKANTSLKEQKLNKAISYINNLSLSDSNNSIPALEIINTTYVYDNNNIGICIKNASFYENNIYVLCGPNGSGKSSFMRTVCSNWNIKQGSIFRCNNTNIINPYKDLVKKGLLAFSFQDPNIHVSGGTVNEYLHNQHIDKAVIEDFCLYDYLDMDMLSTPLWIKKVVIFLSAVYSNCQFLFLDEPFDELSYEIIGNKAIDCLKEYVSKKGRIVLIVTHSPHIAVNLATKYIWIEDNNISIIDKLSCDSNNNLLDWLIDAF